MTRVRLWGSSIALAVLLAAVPVGATPWAGGPSPAAATQLPTGDCGKALKSAERAVDANSRFYAAKSGKAENAALDDEEQAIQKLRKRLPRCDAATVSDVCATAVDTARRLVDADDQFLDARRGSEADEALEAEDLALIALRVRLGDCRSGAAPEPCAALLGAAQEVVSAEDRFLEATSRKEENAALDDQAVAIEVLGVRLGDCGSGAAPAACPDAVAPVQQIVDADARFYVAESDAAMNAALADQERATQELRVRLQDCGL